MIHTFTDMRHDPEIDDEVDGTGFEDWPDADLDIDDEAFAAAIARGRDDEAAA